MGYSSSSPDLPPPPPGWRQVLAGGPADPAGAVLVTAAGGAWAVWAAGPPAARPADLDFSAAGNSRALVDLLY